MNSARRTLLLTYLAEGITCLGTNLLGLGIYFYTKERLGWTAKQNFLLAVGQNLLYIVGSLLAHPMAVRFGRRGSLVVLYVALAGVAAVALRAEGAIVLGGLLLYSMLTSFNWPMLESLAATSGAPGGLPRRISVYNLVWSSASAGCIALSGTVIQFSAWAIFLIPVAVHLVCAGLIFAAGEEEATVEVEAHPPAEPKLLAVRRLALALSRVSLPATYVVIYGLMALFPSLPICREISPKSATVLSSVWMAARLGTFVLLGATSWWHSRPRILLLAAVAMVFAFLGIVLPAAHLWMWREASLQSVILWMLGSQVLLGVCLGTIYSASLYFGMVLSEGSTEHGGYHEALIGLGSAVGPAAGALAATVWPGNLTASISAVTGVIGLSVLLSAGVALPKRGRG